MTVAPRGTRNKLWNKRKNRVYPYPTFRFLFSRHQAKIARKKKKKEEERMKAKQEAKLKAGADGQKPGEVSFRSAEEHVRQM